MSLRSWVYIGSVLTLGFILAGAALLGFGPIHLGRQEFILLAGLATFAQLFKSDAPSHQAFHPALMLVFAAVLVLHPFLFVTLVICAHLGEWILYRLMHSPHLRDWYVQPFNIAVHITAGVTSCWIYTRLTPHPGVFLTGFSILAAITAAVIYTLVNHLLVGMVLFLARKVSWKDSGVLSPESLLTDLMMMAMGIVLAALLQLNPWLLLPALSPSYLIYRALSVPGLKHQASTDPKTGLWNDRYFAKILENELSRAARSDRPLTVVVADLDLLRNINNTFGHLAGDTVLIGVAQILKKSVREYDVVARFGGEEFMILLPETHYKEAHTRVELIRAAIEAAEFQAPTTTRPIKATMSFGIAGRNGEENSARDIIHNADLAVYQAKLRGRNQTCVYSKGMAGLSGFPGTEDPLDGPKLHRRGAWTHR